MEQVSAALRPGNCAGIGTSRGLATLKFESLIRLSGKKSGSETHCFILLGDSDNLFNGEDPLAGSLPSFTELKSNEELEKLRGGSSENSLLISEKELIGLPFIR